MSDNITLSFEEAFKHIKNRLPSNTLKTLEQNYNNNIALDNLQEDNIQRKDFKASNFPNANAQIEQSKLANATNNIELEDFNLKIKNFIELKNKIDNYKSQGYDVSSYENRLKEVEKDLEISTSDKLGVFGRNLPLQYINGVKHFINSGSIELSHSQKMDKAKWEREKVINPIKTMLMDEGLDPINHLGLAFSKGSRLARLGKDYLSGNILGTSTDALKHGGDDKYKLSDSLYAGAFGGVLNAGLGQVLGKSLKGGVNSLDDIQAKVKNDVSLNEYKGDIGDGAIASKLSNDIDKLSPNQANINKTEDLSNSNTLNSIDTNTKQIDFQALNKFAEPLEKSDSILKVVNDFKNPIKTPLGELNINMDYMLNKAMERDGGKRLQMLGYIKPTLERPAYIVNVDGKLHFIKPFIDEKDQVKKFLSVIPDKDGSINMITSSILRDGTIKRIVKNGNIIKDFTRLETGSTELAPVPVRADLNSLNPKASNSIGEPMKEIVQGQNKT